MPHLPIRRILAEDSFTYIFTVEVEQNNFRLDQFTKSYLGKRVSREFIKRKIRAGDIVVRGRDGVPAGPRAGGNIGHTRASSKVFCGEEVLLIVRKNDCLFELEYEHWFNQSISIETVPKVVYEDDNVIVISKPPFMATYPTGRHSINCATVYFESIHKKTIHSIHRIDRETSGVLVLGKNPAAAREITPFFEHGQVRKCYFLIAHKRVSTFEFPLQARERIGRSDTFRSRICMQTYPQETEDGKCAHTTFELLDENEHFLLLLAFPKTGRQHQIRVHAAVHGFPLLGDKIYNGDPRLFIRYKDKTTTAQDYQDLQIPRHALHAYALYIPGTWSSSELQGKTFIAPIPQDLAFWISSNMNVDIVALEEKMRKKVSNMGKEIKYVE